MRRRDFMGLLPKVLACAALAPSFVVREVSPFGFDCSMMGSELPLSDVQDLFMRDLSGAFTRALGEVLEFTEYA